MTDRDTHFQGFAGLHYPELARLFLAMYSYRVLGKEDQARLVEHQIKDLIAQRAYDLTAYAIHALELDVELPFQSETYTPLDIPDFTEWPTLPTSAPRDHAPD